MSILYLGGSVSGVPSVLADLGRTVELIRARVSEALEELGEETAFIASGNAPRKTGALAESIRARLSATRSSLSEVIKPGEFYGRILEKGVVAYGTAHNKSTRILRLNKAKVAEKLRANGSWRIAPRPFMAPAEEEMRGRVQQRLEEATSRALEEATNA